MRGNLTEQVRVTVNDEFYRIECKLSDAERSSTEQTS